MKVSRTVRGDPLVAKPLLGMSREFLDSALVLVLIRDPTNNPTLNRFFSIHFILPFLIAGVTLIHLALLHKDGSNNPIGSDAGIDDVPFYPYFVAKDTFAFFCFLLFFGTFVFYFPNVLNHPDNCIPADPMETPAHVVPEWYEREVCHTF